MRRKSDIEMKRKALEKIVRTSIRLKHSLKADMELNEKLSDMLEAFDENVLRGQMPKIKLTVNDLLKEV